MHDIGGEKNANFWDLKYNFSNIYMLGKYQYPKNREGLAVLINNWKGSKKQPTTTNTTTVQDDVEFIKK